MKLIIQQLRYLTFFMLIASSSQGLAQNNYEILSLGQELQVYGTSTLHDWSMATTSVKGVANIEVAESQIVSIKGISVEIQAESLKSGKNSMDKNAYEALKSKKHPTIYFHFNGPNEITLIDGKAALELNGDLTIAGKTRTENVLVEYRTDKAGNLNVKGSKKVRMTDYGITPPEVMFGTVKTGNDIIVRFNFNLTKEAHNANLN